MHNQTDPNWLLSTTSSERGTGLFLLPDVTTDIFAAAFVWAIPGLTYSDCVRRGTLSLAFKWVPDRICDFQSLFLAPCQGRMCVDRCAEPGCMCNLHMGQCQPISQTSPYRP